jgi:hypothetical protein
MTEETTPPRRPLATFLRAAPEGTAAIDDAGDAPAGACLVETSPADGQHGEEPAVTGEASTAVLTPPPESDPAVVPFEDAVEAALPEPAGVEAPSFLRAAATPGTARPTPRWQWGLLGALALVLLLQILIADRATLAASASTRPLISGICTLLRCALPAWHEPTAFAMLSRDIRPVPGQPGALQVQASFRNDARWAQAWPALRLSLSDADGRVIGRRTLLPADYLGKGADPQARLEPGQSAQVSFRLREPAAATVAFNFEFQ